MNKVTNLYLFIILLIGGVALITYAFPQLIPDVYFSRSYHVLFEGITAIIQFMIFLKAHELYTKVKNKKFAFIAAGFLTAGLLNLYHLIATDVFPYDDIITLIPYHTAVNIQNYQKIFFLFISHRIIPISIFISLFVSSYISDKQKINFRKKVYLIYFSIILLFVLLYKLALTLIPQSYALYKIFLFMENLQIIDESLYFLIAFIYVDMRVSSKKNILSPFAIGIILLGVGQLFHINPAQIQLYGFISHAFRITGLLLVLAGLKDILELPNLINFRQKTLAYSSILLIIFYVIFVSLNLTIFDIKFPLYSPFVFLEFLLIVSIIQYKAAIKLIEPITNIINSMDKFKLGVKPETISVIANDEIGLLAKKLNKITGLNWEYTQEIKHSRDKEKLLFETVSNIRNNLDIDEIKYKLVEKVGKVFNADKCFFREYDNDKKEFIQEIKFKYATSSELEQSYTFCKDTECFLVENHKEHECVYVKDFSKLVDTPGHFGVFAKHQACFNKIKTHCCFGLFDENKFLGAFTLQFKEVAELSDEDINLLKTIVNQALIAMKQAELYTTIKTLNEDLEQKVIERTQQLKTANKELEAFAYTVSHDLRAPLRGMNGYSMALLEDYGDKLDDKSREYLNQIRTNSQKMGKLITDILNLSRLNRTQINVKPVNLSVMAQNIVNEFKKQDIENAESSRNVEYKITEGIEAYGDQALLEVVLQNLIENAWKFTKNTPDTVIEFGITTSKDNEKVIFVKDNGAGFDMRHADKLFMPFQRLHQAHEYPGTGVGLAAIQGIIRRHGGKIWAQSEIGEGSTFFFVI